MMYIDCFSGVQPTAQVSGRVMLEAFVPPSLPRGSCVTVYVQENIQCDSETCDNKVLGTVTFKDPTLSAGKTIPYSLNFKSGKYDYIVSALVNMGWCFSGVGRDWIRDGDYHNDISYSFTSDERKSENKVDITVTKYERPAGDAITGFNQISGTAYFEIYVAQNLGSTCNSHFL